MNNDDIDKNSEIHDEKISALYRQLPDEAPSPDTDALIRAAARRAVGAAPQKKLFTARAQGLMATAATLALGVALVVQWRSEPQQLQEILATTPSSPAPAAAPATDNTTAIGAGKQTAAKLQRDKNVLPKPVPGESDGLDRIDSETAGKLAEAAAPAPQQMRDAEAENRAQEMTAAAEKKSALESRRNEARAASAAPANEALRSSGRFDEYQPAPPAPAAVAPASMDAAAKPQADAAAGKASAGIALLPYQQAMQAGHWARAESLLLASSNSETTQQLVDRELLASLQSSKRKSPDCAALAGNNDALLCRFIALHNEGKALPVDALSQLEKSSAFTDPLAYRRAAIMKLLEKP